MSIQLTKTLFLAAFALSYAVSAKAETTLYVNTLTGNDATAKSSNSAATPWRTIGRAAWGSTTRTNPNSAEAAAAGDTVIIAGGTYITDLAVNNRWAVVYNPVNSGTIDRPIRFTCVGTCILGAPNANGPIIGADGRNHIHWFAEVALGRSWQISTYGRQAGTAASTQVNTTPETGSKSLSNGTRRPCV